MKRRLGYLSAAPRVSTYSDAEAAGPRSHILGVIKAFETLGWEVKPFIVGDRVPRQWLKGGLQKSLSSNFARRLAADLVRIYMGAKNARRAWQEMNGQVDWVYERSATLQSLGWIFKQHQVPWILETSGPYFYEAKVERKSIVLSSIARRLELKAYQECDVLVCVSEALKEIIISEVSIDTEKVVVLPNGVDTEFFNPEHYKPKRIFSNFTVGFVGTFNAWQRLDLLLEALHELRTEGINLSLVAVGSGIMHTQWQTQAERLGIADNVAFIGRVPRQEVPPLIAGFDVGYSGQAELKIGKMYHSPLKIYEYMAMAKPVVASTFEDSRRVLRDGETGFLFQGGDKEELKRALTSAYMSQAILSNMGRMAREEIVTNHSWTSRVCDLTTEVERIIG